MPALHPYSRPAALAKLDGRTKEARLMREVRAELTAHVGGAPSATERHLIERAVQLSIRVACMDRKFHETGEQTDHDARTYLAWSAHLGRIMTRLGLHGVEARILTPKQALAAIHAQHGAS